MFRYMLSCWFSVLCLSFTIAAYADTISNRNCPIEFEINASKKGATVTNVASNINVWDSGHG